MSSINDTPTRHPVRLMARHVVAGDVMPFSGETITDIHKHRDGIRITLSGGRWFWWNDDALMTVIPVGPRPKPADTPPAGFSLHIGQDSLTLWCPICEDCIFENDGDRYYQNFESGVPLEVLNVAAQLHGDHHHAKPRSAPQAPAAGFRPLESIEPASAPHAAAQTPARPTDVDNVECSHGKRLQKDRCHGCEAAEETPHPYNGVAVRSPHARKIVNRCKDCGLSVGDESHNQE